MDTVAADYLAITRFGGNNIEIFAVMYPRLSVIDANDQKASGAAESFLFDSAGQFLAVKAGQIAGKKFGRPGDFKTLQNFKMPVNVINNFCFFMSSVCLKNEQI